MDKISKFWKKEKERIMNEVYTDLESKKPIETHYTYKWEKDGKKRITIYNWKNGILSGFTQDGAIFYDEFIKGHKESFLAHLKDCK